MVETVGLFRDIIICILGVITIVVLILITVLAYSFYHRSHSLMATVDLLCQRANSVLDTIETTSETMRGMVTEIQEAIVSPLSQLGTVIQGLRQGMSLITNLFKKEEDTENERS